MLSRRFPSSNTPFSGSRPKEYIGWKCVDDPLSEEDLAAIERYRRRSREENGTTGERFRIRVGGWVVGAEAEPDNDEEREDETSG